jgi:peroxiredoxin Q/BCP
MFIMAQLTEGDVAPEFQLPTCDGATFDPHTSKTNSLVLFFYPRADTPGCTKEALAFSEHIQDFAQLGAGIVGISTDPVKKLTQFRDKHDLTVTLLSDEAAKACKAYGVWVQKSMYGKTYMGVERSTFLLDDRRHIAACWRKVKVPGHVEAVLDRLRQLSLERRAG